MSVQNFCRTCRKKTDHDKRVYPIRVAGLLLVLKSKGVHVTHNFDGTHETLSLVSIIGHEFYFDETVATSDVCHDGLRTSNFNQVLKELCSGIATEIDFQIFSQNSPRYQATEQSFAAYFRQNYPGPDTIFYIPDWHSPRLFESEVAAIREAAAMEGIGHSVSDSRKGGDE
ncbi:hypothetical protein [Rhizobium sp. RM]|uniref:hypothetical protein n=1 Tax=Rhizobium sp. RM TaxID=2748079 RepID=UPI00110EAC40|nr:hypothetical protein [Rhizobium sp. RM]NWJ24738.1 hypothetical protein [Rhizobium sp. RM]TMV16539.1 hypothetical protein BJG94_19060 [Rhizobium sp. Td3]